MNRLKEALAARSSAVLLGAAAGLVLLLGLVGCSGSERGADASASTTSDEPQVTAPSTSTTVESVSSSSTGEHVAPSTSITSATGPTTTVPKASSTSAPPARPQDGIGGVWQISAVKDGQVTVAPAVIEFTADGEVIVEFGCSGGAGSFMLVGDGELIVDTFEPGDPCSGAEAISDIAEALLSADAFSQDGNRATLSSGSQAAMTLERTTAADAPSSSSPAGGNSSAPGANPNNVGADTNVGAGSDVGADVEAFGAGGQG